MKFQVFADYLQQLEGISARLEITRILAELVKQLDEKEIMPACYLLQGQLLPPYTGLEFQIAVKTVIKAVARLVPPATVEQSLFDEPDFSVAEGEVEKAYRQRGDLGLVVEQLLHDQKTTSSLGIEEVYEQLFALAQDSGVNSQQRKLTSFTQLLKQLDAISAKFVVRIVLGRLRLGFSDMTIIDALSWAMTGGKAERDLLEDAYQKKTDIAKLAKVYLQETDEEKRQALLKEYQVEVGVPVMPALCQRLNSATEMIEKMKEVIAEPKYDGLRVQIHFQRKGFSVTIDGATTTESTQLKTFTRNLEETTHMFPELQQVIDDLKCESCILDAEAIGYDSNTGELLPFQQTIQRKRKHGVSTKAEEIPVRFYVFDILAIDNEDLLSTPLIERKRKLQKLFSENKILYHSPMIQTSDPQELKEFHEQQLADGLEGAVVKQLNSSYQSGRKGWSWVKIKEAEGSSGKLADTLDVIVMGYYFGRGKRTTFGIGAFLVGVFDEENQKILTIAKIGTGLSDEALAETKKRCDTLATTEKPAHYEVDKMLIPDVWCVPEFVVEVAADELTHSPIHSAQLALRFPRLVQFRDDKTWQQATTLRELSQLIKA